MSISEMIPVAEVDAYIRRELLKDVDPYRQVGSVALTPKEAALLGMLMTGRIVTATAFAITAGRSQYCEGNDEIAKVYVFRLRRKLEGFGIRIETLRGQGARMPPESRAIVMQLCGQNQ